MCARSSGAVIVHRVTENKKGRTNRDLLEGLFCLARSNALSPFLAEMYPCSPARASVRCACLTQQAGAPGEAVILTQTQVRRHHLLDQLFQLQVALAGASRLMDTLKLKHEKPT